MMILAISQIGGLAQVRADLGRCADGGLAARSAASE